MKNEGFKRLLVFQANTKKEGKTSEIVVIRLLEKSRRRTEDSRARRLEFDKRKTFWKNRVREQKHSVREGCATSGLACARLARNRKNV